MKISVNETNVIKGVCPVKFKFVIDNNVLGRVSHLNYEKESRHNKPISKKHCHNSKTVVRKQDRKET